MGTDYERCVITSNKEEVPMECYEMNSKGQNLEP
jgi:hypothetical protein